MAEDHGPQIKDPTMFEALVADGNSPGKAARISNAHAAGTLRHDSGRLEDRTVAELRDQAARVGIEGRSRMRKAELVAALRDYR